jgi:hypothetical protein
MMTYIDMVFSKLSVFGIAMLFGSRNLFPSSNLKRFSALSSQNIFYIPILSSRTAVEWVFGLWSLFPESWDSAIPPPHLPAPCNFTSDHGLGQLVNFALCQAHRCFRSSSLSWLELGLSAEMFILLPFHSKNFVLLFSSHSFSFYAKNSPFQLFRSVHIHYMEHGFNSCFLV